MKDLNFSSIDESNTGTYDETISNALAGKRVVNDVALMKANSIRFEMELAREIASYDQIG